LTPIQRHYWIELKSTVADKHGARNPIQHRSEESNGAATQGYPSGIALQNDIFREKGFFNGRGSESQVIRVGIRPRLLAQRRD
jgi:hypothetical protein